MTAWLAPQTPAVALYHLVHENADPYMEIHFSAAIADAVVRAGWKPPPAGKDQPDCGCFCHRARS